MILLLQHQTRDKSSVESFLLRFTEQHHHKSVRGIIHYSPEKHSNHLSTYYTTHHVNHATVGNVTNTTIHPFRSSARSTEIECVELAEPTWGGFQLSSLSYWCSSGVAITTFDGICPQKSDSNLDARGHRDRYGLCSVNNRNNKSHLVFLQCF